MIDNHYRESIDPDDFEMPKNRLLNAKEAKLVAKKGHVLKWIKCKTCCELGATTDDREFCSSHCKANYRSKLNPVELGAKVIKENDYAQKDDLVMYEGKEMKVFLTDCTPERLSKKYKKSFAYILIYQGQTRLVNNLDSPLLIVGDKK